jgi:hypothetical protein
VRCVRTTIPLTNAIGRGVGVRQNTNTHDGDGDGDGDGDAMAISSYVSNLGYRNPSTLYLSLYLSSFLK